MPLQSIRKSEDPSALVKTVMGFTDTDISNYAVKHGVAMEPHAKNMFVRSMKRSHKGFSARDCGLVIMNSSLSDEECEALEVATRLQSACPEWRDHRSGRITASNMKRVFTRVATLCVRDDEDPLALVITVIGYTDTDISNYAVKQGVSMRPHAKNML